MLEYLNHILIRGALRMAVTSRRRRLAGPLAARPRLVRVRLFVTVHSALPLVVSESFTTVLLLTVRLGAQ